MGHDQPFSLLAAPREIQSRNPATQRIKIPRKGTFTFDGVFGGCCDLRNFFTTLCDIYAQSNGAKVKMNVHFTLIDNHPTVLARDLIFLITLDDIATSNSKSRDDPQTIDKLAMLYYTYFGAALPAVLYTALYGTVQRIMNLIDQRSLPSWIHASEAALPAMRASLQWWLDTVRNGHDVELQLSVVKS